MMKQNRKRTLAWKLATASGLLLSLLLLLGSNPVAADGPVLMKAPAKDAAVVVSMPGFPTPNSENLNGTVRLGPEGLVIRQSYVRDGKIVIPPAGLYWDVRASLARPMLADPLLITGKVYYLADTGNYEVVKRDFTAKNGDVVPFGDGSHALQVSVSTSFFPNIPDASFKILKPSGNVFGADFGPVTANPWAAPYSSVANGSQFPEGKALPGTYEAIYHGSNVASQQLTYVVVKEVTKDSVTVREFATGAFDWLELSANKPVTATLGAGETMDLGKYKVKVVKVDAKAKTADVQILVAGSMGASDVVASKTFGPLTDKALSVLPSDPVTKDTFLLKQDDVQVQLDAFRDPFKGDKVSLLGYTGVFRQGNASPWKEDARFLLRPDT